MTLRKLKFIFIYIYGFFSIFNNNFFFKTISAQENLQNSKRENLLFDVADKSNFKRVEKSDYKKNKLGIIFLNDLYLISSEIEKYLANENTVNNSNEKLEIDVESDIQYEKDNIFYAEGNAVIYLFDSNLSGDRVIYNKNTFELIVENNVVFKNGDQFLEASYLSYNTRTKKGFLKDVYGIIDIQNFNKDFELKSNSDKTVDLNSSKYFISNVKFKNSTNVGLENNFETARKFNITDFSFDIPEITKWRFKSKKIFMEDEKIKSDEIFFTNDPYNTPHFILESKDFLGELEDDKLKLVSKSTWINLDNKVRFPIGRRNIIDKDPISSWSLGSDDRDKDGFYLAKTYKLKNLSNDFEFKFIPYILIQRGIKGYSETFVEKDGSIIGPKVKTDNTFFDLFAFYSKFKAPIKNWDLNLDATLNSLDYQRINIGSRAQFSLERSIRLNKKEKTNNNLPLKDIYNNDKSLIASQKDEVYNVSTDLLNNLNSYENLLNLKIYSAYRKNVSRGFSGNAEIYFAKGLTINNAHFWIGKNNYNNLNLIFDIGQIKAEERNIKKLANLNKQSYMINYYYKFPIWLRRNLDDQINENYKYSPVVVEQGINWITKINSGLFFYSDGSKQKAISLNSGPEIILGGFKKDFFDYTKINLLGIFTLKSGNSPFIFDDINKTQRLEFNLEQQFLGPLLFSYKSYLDIDHNSDNYGEFSKATYGLDLKRRAYKLGAFYNTSSDTFGFKFEIFNFNYDGRSPEF